MEEALVQLSERVNERRYGKFRAVVTDNQDPEKRGRLRLRIPSVLGDQESDWALPCLPFGGGTGGRFGLFLVPEVDAQVWMEFEEGDPDRPIWTGTFWQQQSDVPEDAVRDEPTTRLLQTPSGHIQDDCKVLDLNIFCCFLIERKDIFHLNIGPRQVLHAFTEVFSYARDGPSFPVGGFFTSSRSSFSSGNSSPVCRGFEFGIPRDAGVSCGQYDSLRLRLLENRYPFLAATASAIA